MRVQVGKRTVELPNGELVRRAGAAEGVLVDLGCGDGKFAYREARARPGWLAIGVDPVGPALAATSTRALRKPARGGAPNVVLLVAAVDALPAELSGIADRVTVNLPWGSLLAGLVRPDPVTLAAVAAVGRPGAQLSILLNYSVFDDAELCARLGVPTLDLERFDRFLVPAYARAGIEVTSRDLVGEESPVATSWGRRLARGSRRLLLAVEARIREPAGETEPADPAG